MSKNSKVYDNGVAVTYNELVKGLEFHIPSGMTLGEFRDWRKENANFICTALKKKGIADAERLAGVSIPKGMSFKKAKGGERG